MDWVVFPKGVLLGLSIAAPVGPIGLLTIRRSIDAGFRMGFATGLGAATADTIYGAVAAFGLTAIMAVLTDHADVIRLGGGAFLLVIGIRSLPGALRSVWPGAAAPDSRTESALAAYVQTVGLTLTNPMTILAFVAMFAGAGISGGSNLLAALTLVAGVAVGSALWWLILAGSLAHVRHRLPAHVVRLINIVSSVIIIGFGIVALVAAER
jgi:threonine/homoserine/homoserine lactone efflux protein